MLLRHPRDLSFQSVRRKSVCDGNRQCHRRQDPIAQDLQVEQMSHNMPVIPVLTANYTSWQLQLASQDCKLIPLGNFEEGLRMVSAGAVVDRLKAVRERVAVVLGKWSHELTVLRVSDMIVRSGCFDIDTLSTWL